MRFGYQANHIHLCRYKNFNCTLHNRFIELNIYQKDTINKHHWRANIAHFATEIDLQTSNEGKPTTITPAASSQSTPATILTTDPTTSAAETDVAETDVDDYLTSSVGHAKPQVVQNLENSRWRSYEDIDYRRSESPKDYTACSADSCGYCGHCDYRGSCRSGRRGLVASLFCLVGFSPVSFLT